MDARELLEMIDCGEDSRHQFKQSVTHADALATELIAFANTLGGQLLIGVADDGRVIGLTQV